MPLPAFDAEVWRKLFELPAEERNDIVEDLREMEGFSTDPSFDPAEFGAELKNRPGIYVTRLGPTGAWWVYWRQLPRDPQPLKSLHVLHIEPAPLLRPM